MIMQFPLPYFFTQLFPIDSKSTIRIINKLDFRQTFRSFESEGSGLQFCVLQFGKQSEKSGSFLA